ncbi:cilia-and flagella-associated protein 96 isoform X2 [Rhinoderma darwinii]|uniref:cilia-and flagella-associated protein 96 isoform X2 n=1 Tax=Rhinoderma darwinii TaxID=43563 RepID=UPI003F678BE4
MPLEGKSDMDRIGLFHEMGYISIGDKYVTPCSKPFNEAASKNRQMFPGGAKSMANTLGGYFDTQFKRTFEGEAYSDPLKQRRQYRMQQAKKNVGKAFLPSNGEKKASGAGSFYGTLSGPVPAFSATVKQRKSYTAPGKNFYTNPPKQGTGFGYPNLTIGKNYSYSSDNYDISKELMKKEIDKSKFKGGAFRLNLYPREYFDINPYHSNKPLPPLKKKTEKKVDVKPFKPSSPAKEPGGMKAGMFDLYPSHSNDPYGKRPAKSASVVRGGKTFQPPAGPKSYPIRSILESHIIKSVNPINYKTITLMSY